jgi:hypothetical protein
MFQITHLEDADVSIYPYYIEAQDMRITSARVDFNPGHRSLLEYNTVWSDRVTHVDDYNRFCN